MVVMSAGMHGSRFPESVPVGITGGTEIISGLDAVKHHKTVISRFWLAICRMKGMDDKAGRSLLSRRTAAGSRHQYM
jgi:hypothetical protein